jgi:hypothetical protein
MQGRVGAPPLTHLRGGAAIASRETPLARLNLGTPAARHPYLGLRPALPRGFVAAVYDCRFGPPSIQGLSWERARPRALSGPHLISALRGFLGDAGPEFHPTTFQRPTKNLDDRPNFWFVQDAKGPVFGVAI